jgi:GT2 family glycosyltransferase
LREQTYPPECFEVVVIDDGGNEDLSSFIQAVQILNLRFLRQENSGGTGAKNKGATMSWGTILMFLDDDITVVPNYISRLAGQYGENSDVIIFGLLHNVNPNSGEVQDSVSIRCQPGGLSVEETSFLSLLGGFFSIRRDSFLELGMLQDVAPGWWPNWEDVDLAYRACVKGFRFYRDPNAVGYHWNDNLSSVGKTARYWERAARSSAFLFQRHPGLRQQIPMFRDKTPIAWQEDPPTLIARKLARTLMSLPPTMLLMEATAASLERLAPGSKPLELITRWISSGYIYRGYRQGQRALAGQD